MLPHSISQVADSRRLATAFSTRVSSSGVISGPCSFSRSARPCRSVMVRFTRLSLSNGNHLHRKPGLGRQLFQTLPARASRSHDGQRFRSERMQHARRIHSAPAGRVAARENVGAILENQPIDLDIAINGRVDRYGEYQLSMLP